MPTQFDEYEKYAQRLAQIAETLDKKSEHHAALERAGWALAFVTMCHHAEFQDFVDQQRRSELSPQELAHLKKLGLK
jgi:hypothetical protein